MSSTGKQRHPDHHPHAGRGILMALLATVAYAVVDTLSKYQAREYPVGMIVWARYAVPLVLLLAVFLPRRGTAMLRTAFPAVQRNGPGMGGRRGIAWLRHAPRNGRGRGRGSMPVPGPPCNAQGRDTGSRAAPRLTGAAGFARK